MTAASTAYGPAGPSSGSRRPEPAGPGMSAYLGDQRGISKSQDGRCRNAAARPRDGGKPCAAVSSRPGRSPGPGRNQPPDDFSREAGPPARGARYRVCRVLHPNSAAPNSRQQRRVTVFRPRVGAWKRNRRPQIRYGGRGRRPINLGLGNAAEWVIARHPRAIARDTPSRQITFLLLLEGDKPVRARLQLRRLSRVSGHQN
jgi:hypothetical protein